jgi:hypothetical protein
MPQPMQQTATLLRIFQSYAISPTDNLWPQWMSHYYENDTLFGKFCAGLAAPFIHLRFIEDELISSIACFNVPFREAHIGYIATAAVNADEITSIEFKLHESSSYLYRCDSFFDFIDAVVPCYYVVDQTMYLRNLHQAQTTVNCNGTFSLPINELICEDLVFVYSPELGWQLLSINDAIVSGNTAVFTLPITGSLLCRYSSQQRFNELNAGEGKLYLNSENRGSSKVLTISPIDFWNRFDELGACVGLPRSVLEDNYSYARRIRQVYPSVFAPTEQGLSISLGRSLCRLVNTTWSGSGQLLLDMPATSIFIDAYKQKVFAKTSPYINGNTVFMSVAAPELVFLIGNGLAEYSTATDGRIYNIDTTRLPDTVQFIVRTYTPIPSGDYFIGIEPTQNTRIENVQVFSTYGIRTISPSRSNYIENLQRTDSTKLYTLIDTIRTKLPILVGFASWGKAQWFTDYDNVTSLTYVTEALE